MQPACARRRGMALVLLNGSIVGVHRNAPALVDAYRRLRRAGLVGEFVSVTLDGPTVHIASDGGRVCRPLIICDAGAPRVTAAHTAKARPSAQALLAPDHVCRGSACGATSMTANTCEHAVAAACLPDSARWRLGAQFAVRCSVALRSPPWILLPRWGRKQSSLLGDRVLERGQHERARTDTQACCARSCATARGASATCCGRAWWSTWT